MPRLVRCGLIQNHNDRPGTDPVGPIKESAIEKHLKFIDKAAAEGVQILCLQEIFSGPYLCAEQSPKW